MEPLNIIEDLKLKVCVTIGRHELCRNYVLSDGQVPEAAERALQELTDTILQSND